MLKAPSPGKSPALSTVQIAYLPKNIAPIVRAIEVAEPNYRAATTPSFLERNASVSGSPLNRTLPPIGQRKNAPALPVAGAGA